jgi:beta-lactam-binding protein with PASTA domain
MKWLRALCYLVACTIVFMLATSLTIRFLLTDLSTVPCPDVIGLDYEEAKRTADLAGLSLVATKYEVKKDAPYNRVIAQKPDAATPVKTGRLITVILSDGPRLTTIPQFVGLSIDEAQAELQEKALPLKKIIYVPSDANKGKVLAQAPATGENILDKEGMVLIVGGREKRFFVMPDIAVGDVPSVIEELEKKQIKYATIPAGRPESLPRVPPRNRILPNTIFSEDSAIDLPINSNGG